MQNGSGGRVIRYTSCDVNGRPWTCISIWRRKSSGYADICGSLIVLSHIRFGKGRYPDEESEKQSVDGGLHDGEAKSIEVE
jgi:hypothetical protein